MKWAEAAAKVRGMGAQARGHENKRASRSARRATPRAASVPWPLIVVGVALAAATSAAQQRAVAVLSNTSGDGTDPLPEVAPDWLKQSRQARRFWTITSRVINRMAQDNLTLVAAGVAFYAMFSIFPALGALVSIYGFFGDTHVVQAQVQQFTVLLPNETAKLLNDASTALISKPNGSLSSGLLISLGVAIWAARAGTASMMTGLNIALEKPEQRGVVVQYATAIALTIGAIVFALVGLAIVAVIPLVTETLPLSGEVKAWLNYARWPALGAFVVISLDVIYRFGPSVEHPRWRIFSFGTGFAAALLILGTWAFSLYVTRFGSYDRMYGSLGAVIVLLLWFWISSLIVLVGAAIDSVRADMRQHLTAH